MVKNCLKKKSGPQGILTTAARECHEKGMTQSAARGALISKHKATEAVAKSTVSLVYGKAAKDDDKSPSPKSKIKRMKHMTQIEKDELLQTFLNEQMG
jgi:hypothetical protein